jgi:hypothetical protein
MIQLFFFLNLVNQYTVSEKVQLVKFAEYYSANVIDTVKLQAGVIQPEQVE